MCCWRPLKSGKTSEPKVTLWSNLNKLKSYKDFLDKFCELKLNKTIKIIYLFQNYYLVRFLQKLKLMSD